MIKKHLLTSFFLALMLMILPVSAMADAIGTWRLYPCYSNVTEIVPAGDDVFVLASGNLYSYNVNDNSLTEYNKTTCLSGSNIQHIAWVPQAKRLVITYADYAIDILSLSQDVTTIIDYRDKQMTGDKTVNDIYVNGKHAYLSTGFGIIKLNVGDEYIADTYNLGYSVSYCYVEGSYIYAAAPSQGTLRAALTANLLDKSNWQNTGGYTPKTTSQYIADTHNNCYWAADSDSKLVKYKKEADGTYTAASTGVKPDGPNTDYWWRLTINDGIIYCADGQYSVETVGTLLHPGNVKSYDGTTWTQLENNISTAACSYYNCAQCVAVDPKNASHLFVGAFSGLYEFQGNKFVKYYDRTSYAKTDGSETQNIVSSMCFDSSGNLWLVSYGSPYIAMLSASGEWSKYNHSDLLTDKYADCCEGMFVDSRGLIWFCSTRYEYGRIFCYNPKTDVLKRYDNFVNQDGTSYNLNYMRTMAEDKQNNVWLATKLGPFYISASDIVSGNEVMTQHKVPRNDGTNYADYLLTGIDIQSVAVDNANSKWLGTSGSGIYVISSDCNTEQYHFTTDNTPLPSDNITDIKLDKSTGEVFISTDKGLCSYQSYVIDDSGEMTKDNVYAYPNPVTPDFTGMITIVGVTNDAQIKIMTSSGQLVHEGICTGGSYQWNGCDQQGRKVASGVYMVCIATSEGSKGIVTKIGIVR